VFFLGIPDRARAAKRDKRERAGSAKVGPCLTDAAPKAAPGELSVTLAATRRSERQPQRSLRHAVPVVSSTPLFDSTWWTFSQHSSWR